MTRAVLITGASSGLGAGLARSYAAAGAVLWLVGRNAARLEAVAADCRAAGAEVHTGLFDVGVAEPLGSWVLAADDATPLDLVLACAGVSAGPAPDGSPEGLALATLQVRSNLLGTVHTIEPLLPRLMARRRGQIAVVASVAGLRGLPFSPAYSASKAGIRAYGEGLRAFLAPSGVRVSVVVPGFFDTPMTDRFKGDKPFLKTLPQMVARVRRGLDRGAARIVYPQLLALGLVAADLLPAWAGDRILRGVRFHIDPGQ
jgi:NAD(P)-dependent dehydrogenase (short-subunit alcohol dehydrogenase family)